MKISCPECDKLIADRTPATCPACGWTSALPYNRGIAAILSLFIPGAGHMYRGKVGIGLLWLIVTAIGYALIIPGLLLHMVCLVLAVVPGAEERKAKQQLRSARIWARINPAA